MIHEALIEVDLQNDFCPGGSLAVDKGDKVVKLLNSLSHILRLNGGLVFASRDWHKVDNIAHMNQKKWPVHCIQNTWGAAFHPDLDLADVEIISKGMGNDDDGYSAFEGELPDGKKLVERLKLAKVELIYIGGLATDYCVQATVLSGLAQKFNIIVLTDAIQAVNIHPGDDQKAINNMHENGAKFSTTDKVIARYLR